MPKRSSTPRYADDKSVKKSAKRMMAKHGKSLQRLAEPSDARPGTARDHDFTTVARRVVEQAIGEQLDGSPLPDKDEGKNPAAVALGKLGGAKGGKARAKALSPAKRKEIAKRAARTRWGYDR
jgi:hypothetical protein